MKTKTVRAKKTKPLFTSGEFFSSDFSLDENHLTIRLPSKVAQYIKIVGNKVFWTPVNGVIQLSGSQPFVVIPLIDTNSALQFNSHE